MITKFKLFEEINEGEPEVGDYVIVNTNNRRTYMNNIINNSIGKIIKRGANLGYFDNYEYNIIFPFKERFNNINVQQFEIKYWSKNKEDLEDILAAKNYNL